MRIPYGYIMENGQFALDESKAAVVRMIFDYYLAGASLGKVVDLLFEREVSSPTGNEKWTRAAIDKLLSNAKYIPIVGLRLTRMFSLKKNGDATSTMTGLAALGKRHDTNRRL